MTPTDTNLRVLIVAAYASVRAGLHSLLAGPDGAEVVGQGSGSAELERLLASLTADVVLCDGPEGDAARVLQTLEGRGIGLVVLDDTDLLLAPLLTSSLPGCALLRRDADAPEIVRAVHAVAAGLVVFGRTFTAPLASVMPAASLSLPQPPGEALTAREREVLQLMTRGLPNKQIAARLGISAHTAKFHVASILAKLGAASRTEAVTLGARRGDVLL